MKVINYMLYRIRKFILQDIDLKDCIKKGMTIGKNCSIQLGVIFDHYHCNLIILGDNVTIAPQSYLLAHDASTKKALGYTKIGRVDIKDNVFIGARALIMPGVTIGENSIVGAGSVVTKDVKPNTIVVGNHAKEVMSKEDYINKNRELLEMCPKFPHSYSSTVKKLSEEKNKEIKEKL